MKIKTLTIKSLILLIASSLIASSCHRPGPDVPPQPPVNAQADGIYILNEGLFQMNNSTLTYYDFNTNQVIPDVFLERNHRGLGDVGNDLQTYGAKMYCIVNNSNRVEIMSHDATSLKSIDLPNKQPRKLAFYAGKAYVSCFDGDVVRIDTATMEVDGSVHSGSNPEGLCVCDGKLYVANSGGLNSPNYGTTVSVINLNSFSVEKEITVVANPCIVQSYNDRYVYVCSRGNYGNIPYAFQRIDTQTGEIKNYNMEVLNMAIHDNLAYIYNYDYGTSASWIKVMDLSTDQIVKENFITDGTNIQTPYAITVNALNGDVYITDAHNFTVNGDVYCFTKEGKKRFSFEAGLNPGAILIHYHNNQLANNQ